MPIRIRRPNVRTWISDQLRGAVARTAEDLVDSILDEFSIEFERAEEPYQPYFQLDQRCPTCGLRIYESANGISLCLACWMRVDAQPTTPRRERRPPSRPQPGPTRSYKVHARRRPQQPSQPSAPPYEPPTQTPEQRALTLLGLQGPASETEIKKRRRELAFLHHPDRGGDVQKLMEVNEAADVLLDFYGYR